MMPVSTCLEVFKSCVAAIKAGELISRVSTQDKEFHFQNWFQSRILGMRESFDEPGRNTYPDFRMVNHPEGYEIKGLAYPGRWINYDSNSQVPSGSHHGRTIFYTFGRYPKKPDGNQYPVLDLVLCHGDFLNADHNYVHKNKSVRGFGSYGDILIRDRKMYVAPTPFGLTDGTAHKSTLILPESYVVDERFTEVGTLVRTETANLIVGYRFDLRTNELAADTIPNPAAGRTHTFKAYRFYESPPVEPEEVKLRNIPLPEILEVEDSDEE